MTSRVVATAMVAHLWAQQEQDSARTSIPSNPSGGGFVNGETAWSGSPRTWFRGPILYSYNEPIARIVPGADGRPRALLSAGRPMGDVWNPAEFQKWSVATSNHMPGRLTESQAAESFTVPSIAGRPASRESFAEFDRDSEPAAPDHGLNLEYLRTGFRNAVRRFGNVAGVPEWNRSSYRPAQPGDVLEYEGQRDVRVVAPVADHVRDSLVAAWEAANAYQSAFAVPVPTPWQVATEWPDSAEAVAAIAAPLGARLERLEAARNTPEAIAKREAAQAKAKATRERRENLRWRGTPEERVAEWRAGGPADLLKYGERTDSNGGALLRVRGKKLETSQGADVPLSDAVKVFRFVKLCRERGEGWRRNGARVPVGGFQVDSVEPSGDFVAGCHRINWPEIVSAARQAGVLDLEPSADAVKGGGHG
jgi:hypothetical protein